MTDIATIGAIAAVSAAGFISAFWVRLGMNGITDPLIKRLFKYIMALITSLMAISLLFIAWMALHDGSPRDMMPMVYLFVLSVSALMLGSSLAVRHIGDEYGFKVEEKR